MAPSRRGPSPSKRPERTPARSSPVPVKESQLKVKTAGSAVGLATTGGARSTILSRKGTDRIGLLIRLSASFTWEVPHPRGLPEAQEHHHGGDRRQGREDVHEPRTVQVAHQELWDGEGDPGHE